MANSCKTCIAYQPITSTYGTCHQNPPNCITGLGVVTSSGQTGAFPIVAARDWCIQYVVNPNQPVKEKPTSN